MKNYILGINSIIVKKKRCRSWIENKPKDEKWVRMWLNEPKLAKEKKGYAIICKIVTGNWGEFWWLCESFY